LNSNKWEENKNHPKLRIEPTGHTIGRTFKSKKGREKEK
jgi:hypothetical protein